MKQPHVLIVVPFKGAIDYCKNLIDSFKTLYISGFTWSAIFWDDGSVEADLLGLYNHIQKSNPGIMIIKHNNQGYTKTCFDIFETFKADLRIDYLLLTNSDIKFRPASIHAMTKRIMSNTNIAVVGAKVLNYESDTIQHTGTIVDHSCENNVGNPYCGLDRLDPQANFVERRLWAHGCSAMYNLDILRKRNLNFDLNFTPAYFEESDLMTRLNVMGYPIIYEPRAEVEHAMNSTHRNERSKYTEVFWANWQKYLDRWKDKISTDPIFDFGA